jgi:hypothetical protein
MNPETLLTSMPPGEDVASCGEGCRRGASFLFPDSDFLLVFPPISRQSDADTGLIRAVVRGRGCRGAENGGYANHETALMFPIVPAQRRDSLDMS